MAVGTFKEFYNLYVEAFLPEGDSKVKYFYINENGSYELSDDPCRDGVTPIGKFTFKSSPLTKKTNIDGHSIQNVYSALQYTQFIEDQSAKGEVLKLFRFRAGDINRQNRRGAGNQAQEMSNDTVVRTRIILNRLQPSVIYKVESSVPTFNDNVIDGLNYQPRPTVINLPKRQVSYFANFLRGEITDADGINWVKSSLMGDVTNKITENERPVIPVIARAYWQYFKKIRSGEANDEAVSIDRIAKEICEITRTEGFIQNADGLSENQINKYVTDPRGVKSFLRPNNFYNFEGINIQNVKSVVLDDNLNLGNTFIEIGKRLEKGGVDSSNLKFVVGVMWDGYEKDPCPRIQAERERRLEAERERRLRVRTAATSADIVEELRTRPTVITFNDLVDLCAERMERKKFEIVRLIMQNKNLALQFTSNRLLTGRNAAEIAEYIFARL